MFELHPQLAADTYTVAETSKNLLLLANDARYPWLILVPKQTGIKEVFELSIEEQMNLMKVSSGLGAELMSLFDGDKLNVAALGNQVPQLHIHHIVRYENDAAWPKPIWGHGEAEPYSTKNLENRLNTLRGYLSFGT